MKLAVTGCNGRVGQRVVKLALERGDTVIGIDLEETHAPGDRPWLKRPEYTFKAVDLRNYDLVLDSISGCEAVVHLAALSNPTDYKVQSHNLNVVLSWNVLRACAELEINRVAIASSVNVLTCVFSAESRIRYFPVDEEHPCEPDEPYGLSKVICELQADTIIRRYPSMKIASLRLHWSIPHKSVGAAEGIDGRKKDLFGYVQEDAAAEAFLLALKENPRWSGHEKFFIVAPTTVFEEESALLYQEHWPNIPLKPGFTFTGTKAFFDCSKAARLLDWYHKDPFTK